MKTIERMAENSPYSHKVIYPAEIGRAEWSLDHPPSAVGLKLLLLLVSALGDDVAVDMVHDVPVTLLRQVPGISGMSKDDLFQVLLDLARVQACLDRRDPNNSKSGVLSFGALLSGVNLHYSDDAFMSCTVRFGHVFREMVSSSELFAVIDRALALSMKSRYSLLLYQFLATHWRKDRQRQLKLPLSELRRVFALSLDVHSEFKAMRRHVLDKAVSEISEASQFTVTAKPYYEGSRAVAGVVLSWEAKADQKPVEPAFSASATDIGKPKEKLSSSRKPSMSRSALRAVSDADRLAAIAANIKKRLPYAVRDVKPNDARALLAAGSVSSDDLRACQIYV